MLDLLEVRNRRGGLLSLPLDDDSSGYRVAEIEGLGPVKATLVSSSFAGIDGEQYQHSKREARNLKLKLELDPDPGTEDTVDSLREGLYNFFMPKSEVSLRFYKSNGLEVDIVGRVETCEPDIFAQEPTVDISTMCFKPDFIDLTPVVVPGETTSTTTPLIIDYKGSVETGIEFVLDVDRPISGFSIYHIPPAEDLRILDFDNVPLLTGDKLTISTVPGAKGATLIRAGTTTSVLYGVSPQSNWIELMPGPNEFRVGVMGPGVPYTITYTKRYGGL